MPPLATAESSVEERYAAWQRQKHPPTGDLARPAPPAEIDAQIKQSAQEFGVDPSLMTSLFYHESGFDPTAKSEAGAQGIAQFMPEMSKAAGIDPLIPSQAIPAATKHVAYLQKK